MNPRPDRPHEPKLKVGSFAAHASRGILRDQGVRRRTMFVLLVVAGAMVLVGTTVLSEWLNPRERTLLFICYWFVCAWVTITVVLLALYDLLMVRAQGRAAERRLRSAYRDDEDAQ